MRLLHIDSAITGDASVSRQLSAELARQWQSRHADTTVEYLDLAADTPAHLSAQSLGFRTGQAATSEVERAENALTERLLRQFLDSDVIVIGVPFYNFSIPTQLKAWIDRVAQAGHTFKYTEKGPVGLAGGKTVLLAIARGGVYSTSEQGQALEHQESYLRTIFGFFGITDVRVVRAEGVGMGEAAKAEALRLANEQAAAVTA